VVRAGDEESAVADERSGPVGDERRRVVEAGGERGRLQGGPDVGGAGQLRQVGAEQMPMRPQPSPAL
jgi:hypothetical protein